MPRAPYSLPKWRALIKKKKEKKSEALHLERMKHFSFFFFFFLANISFWKQIEKHFITVGKLTNDLKTKPYLKQKENN